MSTNMWKVTAGRGNAYVDDFLEEEVVAIGWPELGPIEPGATRDQIAAQYAECEPQKTKQQIVSGASQVYRFLNEMQEGDDVLTYDADKRRYYLGAIVSAPQWQEGLVEGLPRVRTVAWSHQVSRDRLSVSARNTLGAIMALFSIREEVAAEIRNKAVPLGEEEPPVSEEVEEAEDEAVEELSAEFVEKAGAFIEDHIATLDWEEMQQFVAGILRAMGYRTTVSNPGPDRGYDVFASPDGLGLEEPRIFVEVKHRKGTTIGSQDVRSFLGGRSTGDRCLYVSTGGFTKEARYEADRSNVPLNLLTLQDLRRLLADHYDRLDEETKALVPLKRIYVLAD